MPALHRKENHPTGCWKTQATACPLPFPAEQRTPAYKGMKIPQLSRISRNTSSGRIPAARIS